jgi:hypothetical protein
MTSDELQHITQALINKPLYQTFFQTSFRKDKKEVKKDDKTKIQMECDRWTIRSNWTSVWETECAVWLQPKKTAVAPPTNLGIEKG